MLALELFAGCGGASLGIEAAGFGHAALVEVNRAACDTMRAAGHKPVVQADVRDLDRVSLAVRGRPIDLLWSSFPCQAWSKGGKRRGQNDKRNGWPWTVRAIDRFRPRFFLAENVTGLISHKNACTRSPRQAGLFRNSEVIACPRCYFETVIVPDLERRFSFVGWWVLNAMDFGIPQSRKRLFLWAGDHPLDPPKPTHGPTCSKPHATMRDALGVRCEKIDNNDPRPLLERRRIDLSDGPAPTVVSTYDGRRGGEPFVRDGLFEIPLTPEQLALLQGFPAGYPFRGGRTAIVRQIGNAVPPLLAEVVARRAAEAMEANHARS